MKDHGILGNLHPLTKLIFLAALMFAGLFVVLFAGMMLMVLFGTLSFEEVMVEGIGQAMAENIWFARLLQILNHLGLFIISSLVFAFLVGRKPARYLKADKGPQLIPLLVSALIMFSALPVVNFLLELNMQLSLPEFMKGVEDWMRRTEEGAEQMIEHFLGVTTLQGLLFNIFMIAVIPALGEEFIFRGIILRIFRQWTGRMHLAVWISAILFSAMHLQFFGFLPRLMLGLLLGYMFVYSGNIWLPVFAHFFNNAAAVTFYFLKHNEIIRFEVEEVGLGGQGAFLVVASIVLVVLLFRYLQWSMRQSNQNSGL